VAGDVVAEAPGREEGVAGVLGEVVAVRTPDSGAGPCSQPTKAARQDTAMTTAVTARSQRGRDAGEWR